MTGFIFDEDGAPTRPPRPGQQRARSPFSVAKDDGVSSLKDHAVLGSNKRGRRGRMLMHGKTVAVKAVSLAPLKWMDSETK